VRTSAATAIRASTAAPGDQPADMSALAKVPDVPKVAAENTANPNPVVLARTPVPFRSQLPDVIGHDVVCS
jgi:hypothetical protein